MKPTLELLDLPMTHLNGEDFHSEWWPGAPFDLVNLRKVVQIPGASNKPQDFPLFIRHN